MIVDLYFLLNVCIFVFKFYSHVWFWWIPGNCLGCEVFWWFFCNVCVQKIDVFKKINWIFWMRIPCLISLTTLISNTHMYSYLWTNDWLVIDFIKLETPNQMVYTTEIVVLSFRERRSDSQYVEWYSQSLEGCWGNQD